MNDRCIRISIPVVAGLALVTLLLLAGSAIAGQVPPATSATQPQTADGTGSWSSGWVTIGHGMTSTFEHNLGLDPDSYAVELVFKDTDQGWGINRRNYGGMEFNGHWDGAHWQNLTSNTIQVYRQPDDRVADEIYVRVFVPLTTPDYDSGWTTIAPSQTITFNHSVGITATDLTMGLWFSSTQLGIHHFAYGGLADDPNPPTPTGRLRGANWQNLTSNTVQVFRHPQDSDVEQVRVIVVRGAEPAYDSLKVLGGWQRIAPDTSFTFTHNLNWNPDMLLVRGECYSPTLGIHQLLAGGSVKGWPPPPSLKGANMQNLTSNTVQIFRWRDDDVCPRVRVRIWKRGNQLFLPTVLNDYSSDGD